MNIFLSAIFIFRGLILLLVTEISEQPRYIFANISGLGEYFSNPIFTLKHWVQECPMNPIIGILLGARAPIGIACLSLSVSP